MDVPRSGDRVSWHADADARRDWLWSEAYMVPVVAGCAALGAAVVPAILDVVWLAWVAGAVVFVVVAGGMVLTNRRLTRRGVVAIHLVPAGQPTELTFERADGTHSTVPVGELVEVVVCRDDITRPYIDIRLRLPSGTVRSRPGTDRKPREFMAALTAARVPVRYVSTGDDAWTDTVR